MGESAQSEAFIQCLSGKETVYQDSGLIKFKNGKMRGEGKGTFLLMDERTKNKIV